MSKIQYIANEQGKWQSHYPTKGKTSFAPPLKKQKGREATFNHAEGLKAVAAMVAHN